MAKFDVTNLEHAMFDIEDMISVPEAYKLAECKFTTVTIRNWCERYNIGKKVGGRWYIYPDKFTLLLKGALKNSGL